MMYFHHIHHLRRHIEHFFGHGQILTAILQRGPTTQSGLLAIVGSDIPLEKTLSELEKRRLIKRSTDTGGDVFSLTKRGEGFARRLLMHAPFIQHISESLSDEEKDQFAAILEKWRSNTDGEEFSHFHFRGSHFGFDPGHTGGRGDQ
jgi:DNA-binding MarR family transcriptional regulator